MFISFVIIQLVRSKITFILKFELYISSYNQSTTHCLPTLDCARQFFKRRLKTHFFKTLLAQIPLGSSRLDSTRLDTFDVSSSCILAVSNLSNSTDRRNRHVELVWLGSLDTTRATGATRNLVCCVVCIKL